jgi:hexosaminidase
MTHLENSTVAERPIALGRRASEEDSAEAIIHCALDRLACQAGISNFRGIVQQLGQEPSAAGKLRHVDDRRSPLGSYSADMRLLHFWCAMAAVALAGVLHAQTQHPALLPAVQKIAYGSGSVRLCDLAVRETPDMDRQAVAALRAMLREHCGADVVTKNNLAVEFAHDREGGDLPGADEHPSQDGREGYSISVTAHGVRIHARTHAGEFYAVQTLRQLAEGSSLPQVEIEDWPSLPYRGMMMDMSHGAVPTVAEVKRQLDLLARFKANQYFFYVEANLRLEGYPLLQQPSDWTKQDIAEIVAYARGRHIDVVPCVELYGHLHDIFRQEKYSNEAALEHGGEANPANKDVQKLLDDWLRQYAAMFPSPWFHLGFDEPFELERAGSNAAGGVAPDVLWLQHLQRMAKLATDLGKRPLFWADIDEGAYIFNKYPGLAAGLPKDAIAAPWFYDARPNYDNLLDLFAANHVPILVASGISDWDNIAPDFESTFINIDGFLAAGRKAHSIGLLNTVWSDSALALHREAEPAMAYGAIAAWQSGTLDRQHFFTQYAVIAYPQTMAADVAKGLAAITRSQALLRDALGPETSFRMWDDPFHPQTFVRISKNVKLLKESRLAAEEAIEALISAQAHAENVNDKGDMQGLLLGARMLDYTGMKFIYATEIAGLFDGLGPHPTTADVHFVKRETAARNHSRVGDLLDLSAELQGQYKEEWLKQYKPYRLQTALVRWEAEELYWRHLQASVWTVAADFKEGDARPTLAQVLAVR